MASLVNRIKVSGAVCLYLGTSIGADGFPMNMRKVRYKVARIMGSSVLLGVTSLTLGLAIGHFMHENQPVS